MWTCGTVDDFSVSHCACVQAMVKSPGDLNSRAADMWSYAVLLWELATRQGTTPANQQRESNPSLSCMNLIIELWNFAILYRKRRRNSRVSF